jgi:hypothetical protein
MEVSSPISLSTSKNKYRRVYPIVGLLLYYLGSLIASLEVADAMIFLLQTLAFSIILIIGLAIMKREVIILGEVLAILGSAGLVAQFYLVLIGERTFGLGAIGGAIILVSIFFMILGILTWSKK